MCGFMLNLKKNNITAKIVLHKTFTVDFSQSEKTKVSIWFPNFLLYCFE